MNVQRFEGRDLAEVLRRIRRELGPDAVIVSTQARQGRGLGRRLRRRPAVEIIAGLPEPGAEVAAAASGPAAGAGGAPGGVPGAIPSLAERFLQEAGGGLTASEVAPAGSSGAGAPDNRSHDRLEISGAARLAAEQAQGLGAPSSGMAARAAAPESANAALAQGLGRLPSEMRPLATAVATIPADAGIGTSRSVAEEIRALRAEIAQMRRLMETPAGAGETGSGARAAAAGGVLAGLPASGRDLLERLRAAGTSDGLVERAAEAARASLGSETSAAAGRAAVLRALLAALPGGTTVKLPSEPNAGVFLLGPSGAGKTLAAVKLARALQQSGREVVLANADQQRLGAGAQILAYGEALRIPTIEIYAPSDLRSEAAARPEAVFVVDTAGGLPSGGEVLSMRALLHELPSRQVLLTLSATSSAAEMSRAQAAFASLAPDGLIVSQADEARGFGSTVSFLSESETPLFYLSQHADVLRPLEVTNPATLLERVLQQRRGGVRDEALAS